MSKLLQAKWPKLNILFSAYFIKNKLNPKFIREIAPFANILIDSGAFSLYQDGKKRLAKGEPPPDFVTLEKYIALCKKLDSHVFQYIALDVIRNPKESQYNLNKMFEAGLKPMPVMIEGWPDEKITELVELNEWVCVAGGVGSDYNYIKHRYNSLFEASGRKARIHGLGYSRGDLSNLMISSCDSSSFMSGFIYGSLYLWLNNSFVRCHYKKAIKPETTQEKLISYKMKELLGDDVHYLYKKQSYSKAISLANYISILGFLEYSKFVLSTNNQYYFFACSNINWVCVLAATAASQSYSEFVSNYKQALAGGAKVVIDLLKRSTEWEQTIQKPSFIAS